MDRRVLLFTTVLFLGACHDDRGGTAIDDSDGNSPAGKLILEGHKHADAGEVVKAIHAYTAAIKVAPDNSAAFYYRGLTHQLRGDVGLAIADYTVANELDPLNADVLINRGAAWTSSRASSPST